MPTNSKKAQMKGTTGVRKGRGPAPFTMASDNKNKTVRGRSGTAAGQAKRRTTGGQ